MINKLKKRFTILATISMIILMTVLVIIMNLVNLTSVISESDRVLDVLVQPNAPFIIDDKDITPPEKPEGMEEFIPRGMSPEAPYEARYFTVSVSKDGEISESNLNNIISVDEESAKEYITKAVKSNSTRGFINEFRYLKTENEDDTTQIVFMDCGRKLDAFYTFLLISVGVGLFGCLVVFVAFLFVSGKIVKPIAESYEKQKRFISDAGHEIKTPLTIINANVDLLECDEEKEELTEIRNQVKRLTGLTNNLIFLSRMEETENKMQKIDLPISDIISETSNSFHALISAKSIEFEEKIEPGVSIVGSPDAIRQLVSIVLENANKYTPTNGKITLEFAKEKKSVVIKVTNTTIEKVEEKDLINVFERFYRTDSSRNSSTGGHGIGLSIAKAITEAHNGTINAKTTTGNDFCITIEIPF